MFVKTDSPGERAGPYYYSSTGQMAGVCEDRLGEGEWVKVASHKSMLILLLVNAVKVSAQNLHLFTAWTCKTMGSKFRCMVA